jgi:hypothetical protein
MLRYVCAFTQALLEGRTLAHSTPGHWVYSNVSSCSQQNNDCYFQPIAPTPPNRHVLIDGETLVHKVWSPTDWMAHEREDWHVSFLRLHTMGRTACWGVGQLLFFLMQVCVYVCCGLLPGYPAPCRYR